MTDIYWYFCRTCSILFQPVFDSINSVSLNSLLQLSSFQVIRYISPVCAGYVGFFAFEVYPSTFEMERRVDLRYFQQWAWLAPSSSSSASIAIYMWTPHVCSCVPLTTACHAAMPSRCAHFAVWSGLYFYTLPLGSETIHQALHEAKNVGNFRDTALTAAAMAMAASGSAILKLVCTWSSEQWRERWIVGSSFVWVTTVGA